MPRNKITTDAGTAEVQWSKNGQLVCLVVNDEMYQFTDADELTQVIASLRRAKRQAFREVGTVDLRVMFSTPPAETPADQE